RDGERRALARLAFHGDFAAVRFNDRFTNRKAQARAARATIAHAALVGAKEAVKDLFLILRGDADAVVLHAQASQPRRLVALQVNMDAALMHGVTRLARRRIPPGGGELDRVVEQITHHLPQVVAIARNRNVVETAKDQLDAVIVGHAL